MKFSHLILGSALALVSFFANHAQASNAEGLPYPMAEIRGTKIIPIVELGTWEKNIVDRIIMRSEFGGLEQEHLKVIGTVTNGRVEYRSPQIPRVRALSNSMMVYLTATRICDLALFGECVVYDRDGGRDADAHVFVIGTMLGQSGRVDILQSAFNPRVGRGSSASLYSLAERLNREVNTRSVIFTRSTRAY